MLLININFNLFYNYFFNIYKIKDMDNSFFSSHVMNDSISKIKTNKYKTKTLPYLKNKKKKLFFHYHR